MPTLGYTESDVSAWTADENVENLYGMLEVTATEDGTVTELWAKVDQNFGSAVDLNIALYDSSGNYLIGGTCTHTSGSGGDYEWISYTGFSQSITNTNNYYIAVNAEGAGGKCNVLQDTAGSDFGLFSPTNTNPCVDLSWDDPITLPTISLNSIAVYLVYTAAGGATGKSNPLNGPLGGPLAGAIGI